MNNIVTINNVTKSYNTKEGEINALKNISFILEEGQIISLVGPSGCGKSTILSLISDLDKDYTGTICKKKNLKVAYMLQNDALLPWLTIYENAILGLKIHNKLNEDYLNYVDYLLEFYNLTEFKNNYPKSLSGGMKQRVALIRTLALKPDLLLLDEPFSALDQQSRLMISDDVYKIIKKENKTVIMVTHNISEAVTMANKVIVLSERPAVIKKVFEINLTNASTPINNRKCIEFDFYYDTIWKELDFNV